MSTVEAAIGGDWQNVPLTPGFKGDTVIGNDVWIGYDVTIGIGLLRELPNMLKRLPLVMQVYLARCKFKGVTVC